MHKKLLDRINQSNTPLIMGILNLTPDSFSDGGRFNAPAMALQRVSDMLAAGADIIDIGAESTRPGSEPVADEVQLERMLGIVEAIHHDFPECAMSIDTTSANVAKRTIAAGASMINDISAGRFDQGMFSLVAELGVPFCVMHMLGTPKTMQDNPSYDDVVEEVIRFLRQRAAEAQLAGIKPQQLITDPGIGFGKRREDNLELLSQLEQFVTLGFPVLLGTSKKRFMGALCNESDPAKLGPATIATTVTGVMAGVKIFRVHDVSDNRQAADVTHAIKRGRH